MPFDFTTLITDRSQSDLEAIESLLDISVSNWTAEQLAEFNLARSKGSYNYTDLNRVTEAMEYLDESLRGYGYDTGYSEIEIVPGRTEWQQSDVPTASQMASYLSNVEAIRSVLEVLPTTPETPESMELLTWVEANNIEQILVDVETVINRVVNGLARSNSFTFWSGNRPIPTAESNLGRTWAELDSMDTEWTNWQVATWYLLLYGNLEAEGVVT